MVSLSGTQRLRKLAAAWALVSCCTGCVVTTTHFDDGKTETRWLGFTHLDIRSPSGDEAGPVATRLRSLGIRVGTEFGIGYFDDSYVRIPFDCRIVFLVQTEAQLLEAKRMIDDQPDKGYSCATRY